MCTEIHTVGSRIPESEGNEGVARYLAVDVIWLDNEEQNTFAICSICHWCRTDMEPELIPCWRDLTSTLLMLYVLIFSLLAWYQVQSKYSCCFVCFCWWPFALFCCFPFPLFVSDGVFFAMQGHSSLCMPIFSLPLSDGSCGNPSHGGFPGLFSNMINLF